MNYVEMTEAVQDAEKTIRVAGFAATRIASILVGRLRQVNDRSVLSQLNRELRQWDMSTRKWKDR